MGQIALCLIVNNDFLQSKYCLENLLAKTTVKPKLYILDNGSEDDRVREYFEKYCAENGGVYQYFNLPLPLTSCYNATLKAISEKYVCIVPTNLLVNKYWLEDLIHSNMFVENAGITSIRNGEEKIFLMPFLHKSYTAEDCMENVWFNENNAVEGLMFFDKKILDKVGMFDENLSAPGYEQAEFCFRVSANGFRNYYIKKQTAIKTLTSNEITFPSKTPNGMLTLKQTIEMMVHDKNYKK